MSDETKAAPESLNPVDAITDSSELGSVFPSAVPSYMQGSTFELNDNGEAVLTFAQDAGADGPESSDAGADPVASPEADASPAPEQEDSPPAAVDPYEQRFKDTQAAFTRSQQENADLRNALQESREAIAELRGSVTSMQSQLRGDDPDSFESEEGDDPFSDPQIADGLVAVLAEKAGVTPADFQAALASTATATARQRAVQEELQHAERVIPDFEAQKPVIAAVLQRFPKSNLTYVQAWELAQDPAFQGAFTETQNPAAEAKPTVEPPTTPADAVPEQPDETPEERAARLATASGVNRLSSDNRSSAAHNDLRDAFEQTMSEMRGAR